MIYSYLCGGLGNQMFEYACAYALSRKYDEKLIVNTIQLDQDNLREFGLGHFNIDNNVIIISEKKMFHYPMSLLFRVVRKISLESSWRIGLLCGNWFWKNQCARDLPEKTTDNIYLDGYWQSEKYFAEYKNELTEQFRIKESDIVTEGYRKLLEEIRLYHSVCVHVRLGDYVNHPVLMVCNPEYYRKGIEYILGKDRDARVFVFSDEPDKVKEMNLCDDATYVDKKYQDYESLSLMMACKHFLISNSSFSWWAQYLGKREEKIVVGPEKWQSNSDNYDLCDLNWIRLGVGDFNQ